MSSATLCAVVLLLCALTFSAAQSSCRGRCGSEYYRGNMCQCDYNCLSYGECCKDFESQCTTSDSCKGRCGEDFKRGRLCSCDSNCEKYKQCCSDFDHHCDALEEISGATSETAPGKTSSCHNVNNNKPKEPPQSGATDVSSTFSEGDNTDDHLIPLVSPTSYPQDDLNDDIFPNDEYSDDGFGDLEATPIPESTSGYGSSTADLLDQLPTEPTQNPDTVETTTETVTADALTQTTLADNEPTQADSSPSTIPPTMDEVPTISTDAGDPTSSGTTPPQPTTAAVSSLPVANSEHPRGDSPGPNNPEPVTEATSKGAVSPDGQNTDPTVISINEPEDTTLSLNTTYNPTEASVSTVTTQDSSAVSTSPASPTQDPTPIPMTATSAPGPDVDNKEDVATELPTSLPDLEDPSIGVTPSDSRKPSEPDALTVNIPTSTEASRDAPTEDQARTTADPLNVPADPTKPTRLEETSKPQDKPKPVKPIAAKPSSKPETKPLDPAQTLNVDNPRDYQADDSNDTNLCSGRPVSGVTTLRNGTIVVFRGHYFWVLDRNRVPGQAQDITQVWGVPSPIDTVFTRCNCQGKTYIFRGPQYWRYENDVLDSGYPKVIETGFDGLRGHITAALSVPQYQRRRESVYFFKRGGNVQKYSYQFGTSPKCGRKPQYAIYTVSNRIVRQAVSALGGTINIRTSWRGFPPTITAAVSIPSYREPEGYKYYVVSRSKSYKVRMDTGRPEIPAPAANTSPQSNVFKCPKKL